jgi:hypothetical protein
MEPAQPGAMNSRIQRALLGELATWEAAPLLESNGAYGVQARDLTLKRQLVKLYHSAVSCLDGLGLVGCE